MTLLTWSDVGKRFYETGVDRGVLYVGASDGVAWNGLTSVVETPSGGELSSFYMNGINYLNVVGAEAFEATISAFYSPPEFDVCDGTKSLAAGLTVGQQPRVPFGFSYRTKIGNDVDGSDHGYKIHIVYNALATPTSRDYTSINESPDPSELSWKIVTKPNAIANSAPGARISLDSTMASPAAVSQLEDILYGTPSTAPRLPLPAEVIALVAAADLIIVDNGDGSFSGTGGAGIVDMITADIFQFTDPDISFPTADTYQATSP